MTDLDLIAQPLTSESFSPFGSVIELGTVAPVTINEGRCQRYTDLAPLEVRGGRQGLSLFHADLRDLPLTVPLLERHPLGSQSFIPMGHSACLIVVAHDVDGRPGQPVAFVSRGDQGVSYPPSQWHGVLAPISGSGVFAVVDRIETDRNLEEHRLDPPVRILGTVR